jgi:hypothetical protein
MGARRCQQLNRKLDIEFGPFLIGNGSTRSSSVPCSVFGVATIIVNGRMRCASWLRRFGQAIRFRSRWNMSRSGCAAQLEPHATRLPLEFGSGAARQLNLLASLRHPILHRRRGFLRSSLHCSIGAAVIYQRPRIALRRCCTSDARSTRRREAQPRRRDSLAARWSRCHSSSQRLRCGEVHRSCHLYSMFVPLRCVHQGYC